MPFDDLIANLSFTRTQIQGIAADANAATGAITATQRAASGISLNLPPNIATIGALAPMPGPDSAGAANQPYASEDDAAQGVLAQLKDRLAEATAKLESLQTEQDIAPITGHPPNLNDIQAAKDDIARLNRAISSLQSSIDSGALNATPNDGSAAAAQPTTPPDVPQHTGDVLTNSAAAAMLNAMFKLNVAVADAPSAIGNATSGAVRAATTPSSSANQTAKTQQSDLEKTLANIANQESGGMNGQTLLENIEELFRESLQKNLSAAARVANDRALNVITTLLHQYFGAAGREFSLQRTEDWIRTHQPPVSSGAGTAPAFAIDTLIASGSGLGG